jgi:hypothetical protein
MIKKINITLILIVQDTQILQVCCGIVSQHQTSAKFVQNQSQAYKYANRRLINAGRQPQFHFLMTPAFF